MAINTTGNNGSVVGVTGVHPDNIGKGLFWDEATKTYYVAIDDKMFERDELGRLKLRVSALEDNQLKLRDDGLYQIQYRQLYHVWCLRLIPLRLV